jgi:putative ABC transport system permease protein
MKNVLQDLRFGLRVLRKNPGFTAVAVLTLALGIGANTAIFSVVNSVVLAPLPFPGHERLVTLWFRANQLGRFPMTQGHFAFLRAEKQSFENLAAYYATYFTLTGEGEADRLRGAIVSHEFLPTLGVEPLQGRWFLPEEDTPNNYFAAVIGYGLWQRRFGGDPQIIGKALQLNGQAFTVVGIMPAGFDFPSDAELWTPIGVDAAQTGSYYLRSIGRLKAGVSLAAANAETNELGRRFALSRPDVHADGADFDTMLTPLKQELVGDVQPALLVLLGAVGFVLLIACANVANLLLARSTGRAREIAVRGALGAGRWRVARQLITESLLLALLGGGAGLLVAVWAVGLLRGLPLQEIPRIDELAIDLRVLAFTFAASLLTGALFGLAPVLRASRLSLLEALKEGARGSSLSFAAGRAHGLLVAAQFALSLVLLAGAGLLLKSFGLLLRVDPGFRPQSVLALQISLPGSTYPEQERVRRFYTELRERVGRLPGVEAAGLVGILPFSQQQTQDSFTVEGRESEYRKSPSIAGLRPVSGAYFEAMGIPLIDGRMFSETDQSDAPPVTIISQSMARQYWPGGAVGRRLKRGRPDDTDNPWMTIVGVVGDVKEQALDGEAEFLLYQPHAQFTWNSMALVARTRSELVARTRSELVTRARTEPTAVVAALREQVRQLDAQVPIYQVRTMQEAIDSSLKQRRFSTFLIGLFAAVALLLSAVGIYGTMALNVGSRVREIAIRMAIGADRPTLLRMVLTRGLRLAFVGLGLGLVAAFGLTRLLSGFLYGVSPLDPQVFALASLVLFLTGTVACYLPAYRATRVDPMLALRDE